MTRLGQSGTVEAFYAVPEANVIHTPHANATPRRLGYRMPASWQRTGPTFVSWPCGREAWGERWHEVRQVAARMVRALREHGEEVRIATCKMAPEDTVAAALQFEGVDPGAVSFVRLQRDTEWLADMAPVVLEHPSGSRIALDGHYNAWGEKYAPWHTDAKVAGQLAQAFGLPLLDAPFTFEPPSVDTDGDGLLLATESTLLGDDRNPDLGRDAIEALLLEWLCAERVLWLADGMHGDDTDGQVSSVARFAAPGVVLAAVEQEGTDRDNRPLRENLARLLRAYDRAGKRVEIVTVPLPSYRRFDDLALSYLRYHVGARCVLVPTYGCPEDEQAIASLRPLFPDRELVPVDARPLAEAQAGISCLCWRW
ncbi:MAG: agmatine deiminase family protein [Candidatus Sumerlaeia bacterium]|nr:agmatine deiminase family protein [Candidatus Sumerlaeia bacterium]